ncbi:tyrosine--tRNA ligase 1, cytoplasmic-like protein [Tanacetum coccineum]
MDVDEKLQKLKSICEECIQEEELKDLLMKNPEPVCFDEFEPFVRMHIAQGIMKTININKLTSAGCKVKIWIADWYAQSVMKLGGDLAKLQKVGNYFKEIWIAAGMDMEKVEFIWSTDEINSRPREYWETVMVFSCRNKLLAVKGCCQEMGQSEQADLTADKIFYACMRCADIVFTKVFKTFEEVIAEIQDGDLHPLN